MAWLLLLGAIAAEVAATLSLKRASAGERRWFVVVSVGYFVAFVLFASALRSGFDLGVAYGIWTALGIVATTLLSRWLFDEPVTIAMGVGIVCMIAGVGLIELG